MSSPPAPVGGIDLDSVLNVRRRTLTSIGESAFAPALHRHTDTVYVTREDDSNSLLSIKSKIVIFGELQFLCSTFERFSSNIAVHDPTSASASFDDTEDDAGVTAALSETSLADAPGSPPRRKKLNSIGRSQTVTSAVSNYSSHNLEGKRYGSIEVGSMSIIEILEILMRVGLELVNQSSEYDHANVLHQSFVLSKQRPTAHKTLPTLYARSTSLVGT